MIICLYEYVHIILHAFWKFVEFNLKILLWNCCNFRPVHLISWRLLQALMELTSMAFLEISQRLNWGKLLGKYLIICHFHLETLFPCLLVKPLNGRHCLVDLHSELRSNNLVLVFSVILRLFCTLLSFPFSKSGKFDYEPKHWPWFISIFHYK